MDTASPALENHLQMNKQAPCSRDLSYVEICGTCMLGNSAWEFHPRTTYIETNPLAFHIARSSICLVK